MKHTQKIHKTNLITKLIVTSTLSVGGLLLGSMTTINNVHAETTEPSISETTTPDDVTAQGTFGTSHWTVENSVLHFGPGEFASGSWTKDSELKSSITEITFDSDVTANRISTSLFSGMSKLVNINNIDRLDGSNIMKIDVMFAGDESLKTIDLTFLKGTIFSVPSYAQASLLLGSNFKLQKLIIPENLDLSRSIFPKTASWRKVGSGTEDNPQGNIIKSPKSPISTTGVSEAGTYIRITAGTLTVPIYRETVEDGVVKLSPDGNTDALDIERLYGSGKTEFILPDSVGPKENGNSTRNEKILVVTDDDGNISLPTGDPSESNSVIYRINPVTADVKIPSNEGDQIVKDQTGKPGEIIDVTVPQLKGYTSDKKTIKATVGDKEIIANEKVTYTKIPSGSHGGSSNSNLPTSETSDVNIYVQTFYDRNAARLYDNDGHLVENRALRPNSGWFADKKLTRNGTSYYRVATHEWVKMNDVYVYTPHQSFIRTNPDSNKQIVNAHQELITNRQLASNSEWITDMYTYMTGAKYYRIANNEFVKADDITEYTP